MSWSYHLSDRHRCTNITFFIIPPTLGSKSKHSCRDLCSPPQYIYIIVIHILDLFKVYPTFWFCSELNITENIAHFSLTAGKISPGSRDWNLQTDGKHKFLWQIRGSQRWFFSSLTAGRILDQRETKNNTQPWDSSVVLQNVFPGVWQPPTLLVQGHTGVYRTKCSVCVCAYFITCVHIFWFLCTLSPWHLFGACGNTSLRKARIGSLEFLHTNSSFTTELP